MERRPGQRRRSEPMHQIRRALRRPCLAAAAAPSSGTGRAGRDCTRPGRRTLAGRETLACTADAAAAVKTDTGAVADLDSLAAGADSLAAAPLMDHRMAVESAGKVDLPGIAAAAAAASELNRRNWETVAVAALEIDCTAAVVVAAAAVQRRC